MEKKEEVDDIRVVYCCKGAVSGKIKPLFIEFVELTLDFSPTLF